jgi:hypothetical protein
MKVKVVVELNVSKDFTAIGPWTKSQCLDSFISHWLEEGDFVDDHIVELPSGIKYKGYRIVFPKGWSE